MPKTLSIILKHVKKKTSIMSLAKGILYDLCNCINSFICSHCEISHQYLTICFGYNSILQF